MKTIKETLHMSDYYIYEERQPMIDKSVKVTTHEFMKCPSCSTKQKAMKHSESRTCYCGLRMQLFGNGLHCEKDKKMDLLGDGFNRAKDKMLKITGSAEFGKGNAT